MPEAIIVHGGAGKPADPESVTACIAAAQAGWKVLEAEGSAVAAVEAAISSLENCSIFDAGAGAYLNLEGQAELDAGLMSGSNRKSGCVGAVVRVCNPIQLARRVLEDTTYVLVVGDGAVKLARLMGLPLRDLRTAERRAQWEELSALLLSGDENQMSKIPRIYRNASLERWAREGKLRTHLENHGNTVGAAAIDKAGHVAAGSSTGGSPLKWPGRVGSAALPGAGFYAEDGAGAAAATGHGETIIQELVCREVVERMRHGDTAQSAVNEVLDAINSRADGARRVGIIAVDSVGRCGAGVNIPGGLPSALMSAGMSSATGPFREFRLPKVPLPESLAPI